MKSEFEARLLLDIAERQIKEGLDKGLVAYPQTPLEAHAFALGRQSVLKWFLSVEPTDAPGGE